MRRRVRHRPTTAVLLRICLTATITLALVSCLVGCEGHNSDNLFFKTESPQRHTPSAELLSGTPCEHPLPS